MSVTEPWARALVVIEPDSPTSQALAAHLRAIFPDWSVKANPEHDPLDIREGVVLLGSKLAQDMREQLIASLLGKKNVVVVVLLPDENDPTLHQLVRSGVHGVGFANTPGVRIKRVIENALAAWERRHEKSANQTHERIVNFPWLLEELAANLESLAQDLQSGSIALDRQALEQPAHSFQVKRAIAGALVPRRGDTHRH